MIDSNPRMAKVLPDREIALLIGKAIIGGSQDCIRVNSYEVRLGRKALFDSTGEEVEIAPGSYLEIDPGDLVAVESLEKFDFSADAMRSLSKPNGVFGWITPTTTMMREGFLFASTKVDAGYRGNLNWSIRNSSIKPIRLQYGERIFKLTIMELDADERPQKFYGENEQDRYQDTSGIRESARLIQANIPEKLLVHRTKSKVEPIKQLEQAGHPFNHIGTELRLLHGKWDIVSTSVGAMKTELDALQKSIETKIDAESNSISATISGLPDKIDSKMRSAFADQFGLYFDQRMQTVYGTVLTLVALGAGVYKIIIERTSPQFQSYTLLAIGGLLAVGTFLLRFKSNKTL
jgi:deoxycytidine triphosphate deaminase